jgi:hypothetical protein
MFVKNSSQQEMGSNFSKFMALPKIFGIAGPLIAAILIPHFGFLPVFILGILGMIAAYFPLARLSRTDLTISLTFSNVMKKLKENKVLFTFEWLENIIEESDWFWAIYVFILIGSLSVPGIVDSMEAIGGALFTLVIGKYANKHGKQLIPWAAFGLIVVNILRIITNSQISAYAVTIAASFALSVFVVCYFSTLFKTIKDKNEDEFIILREIPTVMGRMVAFAGILLFMNNLRFFFVLPIFFTVVLMFLYIWKKSHLEN